MTFKELQTKLTEAMKEKDFNSVEKFLEIHNNEFVAFDSLMLDHIGTKDIFSKIIILHSSIYFSLININ